MQRDNFCTMPNTPLFSIVIPTLNEEKYLHHLLKDLSEQTFDLKRVEIIHVDGNSQDNTVKIARKFAKKLSLTSFVIKGRNVALQRNTGASHAKGDWIIFMDADDRLPQYFLDGIKYQLAKNSQTDIFTCLLKPEKVTTSEISVTKAVNLSILVHEKIGIPFVLGALIGVRRIIFKKYQFNPKCCLGEDVEFVRNVAKEYLLSVFEEPKFTFSLRRFRKEGMLKLASMEANIIIRTWMTQISSTKNYGYVMEGGAYYDQKNEIFTKLVQQKVKKMTSTQLKKIKQAIDPLFKRFDALNRN